MFPKLKWYQFIKRMFRRNLYSMMTKAWWDTIELQLAEEKEGRSGAPWDGVLEDIGDIQSDIEDAKGRPMP